MFGRHRESAQPQKQEVAQYSSLKEVSKPAPPLITATGEKVLIEGVVVADITIDEKTAPAEFFLVSELTDDVILGLDTLRELGVLIEYRRDR